MAVKPQLQEIYKSLRDLSKGDRQVQEITRRLKSVVDQFSEGDEPKNIRELFVVRRESKAISSKDVSTPWLAEAMDYFETAELAALIGTSTANIRERIKYDKEIKKRSKKMDGTDKPDNFSDDPLKAYESVLNTLYKTVNDADMKPQEKLRAIDSIMKYIEAQVLLALREKFEVLDGLINYLINVVIPQSNKRIRELLREAEARIKAGEDTKFLVVDLRVIFRGMLPTYPTLLQRLNKLGIVEPIQENNEGKEMPKM